MNLKRKVPSGSAYKVYTLYAAWPVLARRMASTAANWVERWPQRQVWCLRRMPWPCGMHATTCRGKGILPQHRARMGELHAHSSVRRWAQIALSTTRPSSSSPSAMNLAKPCSSDSNAALPCSSSQTDRLDVCSPIVARAIGSPCSVLGSPACEQWHPPSCTTSTVCF